MVHVITDIENKKKELNFNATPFDVGYNAGIEAAKAIVYNYAHGGKCIMCGSEEHMDGFGNCANCGFSGYGGR